MASVSVAEAKRVLKGLQNLNERLGRPIISPKTPPSPLSLPPVA